MKWGKNECELILRLARGIGPVTAHKLIIGDAKQHNNVANIQRAISLDVKSMRKLDGLTEKGAIKIRTAIDEVLNDDALQIELDLIHKHKARLVSLWDVEYPRMLRYVPGCPRLLWVKGNFNFGNSTGVAIVGARKCTAYGREQADRMSGQLAESGFTIISGGAKGIDAAAHLAAINRKGRTIAVLGSGLAQPYPKDNLPIFRSICELERDADTPAGGAVISEVPMMTAPRAELFPARNRIISGMSLAVLIIEAANKSGAMRTASHAIEQGRDLLALPGRIDSRVSAGCHTLLKDGLADLVTSASDVLDVIAQQTYTLAAIEDPYEDIYLQATKESKDATQNPTDNKSTTIDHESVTIIDKSTCEDESAITDGEPIATDDDLTTTESTQTTTPSSVPSPPINATINSSPATTPPTSHPPSTSYSPSSTTSRDKTSPATNQPSNQELDLRESSEPRTQNSPQHTQQSQQITAHPQENTELSNQELECDKNSSDSKATLKLSNDDIVAAILKHLGTEDEARSLEELVMLTKIPFAQLQSQMIPMEIRGQVARRNGLYWKRKPRSRNY